MFKKTSGTLPRLSDFFRKSNSSKNQVNQVSGKNNQATIQATIIEKQIIYNGDKTPQEDDDCPRRNKSALKKHTLGRICPLKCNNAECNYSYPVK